MGMLAEKEELLVSEIVGIGKEMAKLVRRIKISERVLRDYRERLSLAEDEEYIRVYRMKIEEATGWLDTDMVEHLKLEHEMVEVVRSLQSHAE